MFTSVYISSGPGTKAKKRANMKIRVILLLIRAFLVSSFLLAVIELRQIYSLAIFLKVNNKGFVFFLNKLANLLVLERLKL